MNRRDCRRFNKIARKAAQAYFKAGGGAKGHEEARLAFSRHNYDGHAAWNLVLAQVGPRGIQKEDLNGPD